MSYREWKNGIPARNAAIYGRVLKSQGSELSEACRAKTLLEIEAGWLTEPIDVTDDIIGAVPITPRYAISEKRGNSAKKYDSSAILGHLSLIRPLPPRTRELPTR